MRSMSLARKWISTGGTALIVTSCTNESLIGRLKASGIEVVTLNNSYPDKEDLGLMTNLVSSYENPWILLDGYFFDEDYRSAIKKCGCSILMVDDYQHLEQYYVDAVVNPGYITRVGDYKSHMHTEYFLGPEYAFISDDLESSLGEISDKMFRNYHILVTLGASDSANQTEKVLKALNMGFRSDMDVVVVVGPLNQNFGMIKDITRDMCGVEVVYDIKSMVDLYQWSDVAITAAGSTCWELAYMGVPMITIVVAENQIAISEYLENSGVSLNLGWFQCIKEEDINLLLYGLLDSHDSMRDMNKKGKILVDGYGCDRLVTYMKSGSFMS